jgi:hypothetical protein
VSLEWSRPFCYLTPIGEPSGGGERAMYYIIGILVIILLVVLILQLV